MLGGGKSLSRVILELGPLLLEKSTFFIISSLHRDAEATAFQHTGDSFPLTRGGLSARARARV